MRTGLLTLALLVALGSPAIAAPIITLGPPVAESFSTIDPGSIRVEMLDTGDFVELQVSMTVHPFCIAPIDIVLGTSGDGGAFADQTGVVTNTCGGDTSEFNIRLTGDGIGRMFDIEFLNKNSGSAMRTISVELFPGDALDITLGPPVTDAFSTVDPGSIRIEQFSSGDTVALRLSMAVNPFCIAPIDIVLGTSGDGGTFEDQTGVVVNTCGGDISEFDIELTGDGLVHTFDINFLDQNSGTPLVSIPVALIPGSGPIVTLGAPLTGEFASVDPGSIRVEMLNAGDFVDLQLAMTVHPFCIAPIDIVLSASGDGGAFSDQTGFVTNTCGGDTSEFNIRLTGDGIGRMFDIEFLNLNSGSALRTISVELFPGAAPDITLGPPVTDAFSTVDPGSIRIDRFGSGDTVALRLSMAVNPFCIAPIDIVLGTSGDGGTFEDQTGVVVNTCGGDISEFDIELTGDGLVHTFDINFLDQNSGTPLASIPVALFPGPAPIVTLGAPLTGEFTSVDPGSIRVEMLDAGNFVDVQLAMTVHPFCFVPIDIVLGTSGDGGTFADQTGLVTNSCGGDTSVFDIRLTGDGLVHAFDIDFIDMNSGTPLVSIPVELFPRAADTDSDGVTDLTDNCTEVANTDQRDTDFDGFGNACDADLDNDCFVDFEDLALFGDAFGTIDESADFNGNGFVGFDDLGIFGSLFGAAPGPSAATCVLAD